MISGRKLSVLPARPLSCCTTANNTGFTLVELLVVAAILGILAIMSISGFALFKEQARVTRCISEIRGLEKDIGAFAVEKGTYPVTLADINRGDLLDPWGNLYIYKPFEATKMRHLAGVDLNSDYDLYSKGADGITDADLSIVQPDSLDDIIRGRDGGYAGMASKY